mgnify:CR=1 FL=1
MAEQGLRVLAVAYKDSSNAINSISDASVNSLIFMGFVGMKDSPREGVKEAIKKAKQAGIRVIMNTGDHKITALTIAKEIGLVSGKNPLVLIGEDLEKMSESEFDEAVRNVDIFARVTPQTKYKIVVNMR